MLSNFDIGNLDGSNSELSNGQLLRDIEDISNALYVDRKTQNSSLISSSSLKSHFIESKSKWDWKWKPLKVLSHIRHKKLSCYFFCHVHSVENLPSNFEDICVSVLWKRKDDVLRTRPLAVSSGMVDFEETLMTKCTVYGAKNGPRNFMKYDPKHFLLCVSVVGAEECSVGKHWVDLTRMLPLTLEELEKDKCSGKWSTIFKLEGKAEGATLQVSFGFLVTKDSLSELGGNIKLPLLNLEKNGLDKMSVVADCISNTGNASLRRAGSVPSSWTNSSSNLYHCLDVEFGWQNHVSDFSNSINMLQKKLEGGTDKPAKIDLVFEHLESLKLAPNSLVESKDFGDGGEFTVIEKGVESLSIFEEELMHNSTVEDLDASTVEVIDVAEFFKGDGNSSDEDTKSNGKEVSNSLSNDLLIDKHCIPDVKELAELEPSVDVTSDAFKVKYIEARLDVKELAESEPSVDMMSDEFKVNYIDNEGLLDIQEFLMLQQVEDFMCGELNVKRKGIELVKSLSLDDVAKAVVEDFCNLWQESTPSTRSSNTNLESPRERLLRQFEEDMMTSENFFLGVDIVVKESDSESDHAGPSISSTDYTIDSVNLSPIIINDVNDNVNHASQSKIQAKTLETLETQSLMQRWGFNEDAFLSSPDYSAGGFGSPIFVHSELEELVGLPPLGEGLDPFLQLKNGGLLRSMSPLLFKNAKNYGRLIMQASKVAVLPAELGSDIIEILHGITSVGSERLSTKLHSLLPLDELSGMKMQQLAWEASYESETCSRSSSAHDESDFKIRIAGASHVPDSTSVSSSSTVDDTMSRHLSKIDLSAFILDTIETLAIEGLKVQSGMSYENAPSSIKVKPVSALSSDLGIKGNISYIDGLLDLSISLDEWLRIDSGMFNDETDIKDRTLAILRAHQARNLAGREIVHNEPRKYGLMGDNLTVGLMIQLRDPLRNYEPVGTPMLGLIQMERVLSSSGPENEIDGKIESEEDDQQRVPTFRLKEVHVAGLILESDHTENWASKRQQQSGSRWLLASGLAQGTNPHFSTSSSLVRFSTQVKRKLGNRSLLWSISRPIQGVGINTQFSTWGLLTRNPDLVFP